MGEVSQRAGGGKVTVEGLSAGVVKTGTTVKIKQGSKTIEQVTGNLNRGIAFVLSMGGGPKKKTNRYVTGDSEYFNSSGKVLKACNIKFNAWFSNENTSGISFKIGNYSKTITSQGDVSDSGTLSLTTGQTISATVPSQSEGGTGYNFTLVITLV